MKLNKEFKNYTKEVDERASELLKANIISWNELEKAFYDLDTEDKKNLISELTEELDIDVPYYYTDFEDFLESCFNNMVDVANAVKFGDYRPDADYYTLDGYNNIESKYEKEIEEEIEEIFEDNKEKIIDLLIDGEYNDTFAEYKRQQEIKEELIEEYCSEKEKRQKAVDSLPLGFAFSDEQFNETMKKWGLDAEKDIDKIVNLGCGGFIQKKDFETMQKVLEKNSTEEKRLILNKGVLIGAIVYELGNHEYIYTYDPNDALDAIGCRLIPEKYFDIAKKIYLASAERYN